jgi:mono/diheme cytochrome c family protein
MKSVLAIISILVVLSWSAPAWAADAAAGKELYAKRCASCHGAAGEGKDAVAKTLKVELRHLASKEVQSRTDEELKKVLLEGSGKMKPVTGVDAKGADDVVAYLRTLKK